jgi:hypothetical protein
MEWSFENRPFVGCLDCLGDFGLRNVVDVGALLRAEPHGKERAKRLPSRVTVAALVVPVALPRPPPNYDNWTV